MIRIAPLQSSGKKENTMSKKHDKALTATWYEGRDVGYQEGHHDGLQDGRKDGDNYEKGFQEGHERGYKQGLTQVDGYQKGYAQHAKDARDAKEA